MKSILVSYLDHNKVVDVPMLKEESDVTFIKKEFRKQLSFGNQVSVEVTLQWFDQDWDEYVDLNSDDEVATREKLKVVVTSKLHTPTITEPVSHFCCNLTVANNVLVPVCIFVNSLILCEGHVKLSVKPQSLCIYFYTYPITLFFHMCCYY